MSNLQSKVLSACAWFFGITFVIAGFGILLNEGGWFSGLLIIIGSCLLLPPIKRLILDKKPNLSRGKITAAGSILILIGCFVIKDTGESSVVDTQPLDNITDKESVVLEAEPDAPAVEESGYGDEYVNVNDEIASEEGYVYDDESNSQENGLVENKRSKLPALSLEFYFTVTNDGQGNPTLLSIVSRNKKPIHIYDIILNDGISCPIYGEKISRNGIVSFGEKHEFPIVGCDPDQIVEVKVVTEKGYVTGGLEVIY